MKLLFATSRAATYGTLGFFSTDGLHLMLSITLAVLLRLSDQLANKLCNRAFAYGYFMGRLA